MTGEDNFENEYFDQTNTAVNLKIIADTDPNGDGGGEITNKDRNWLVGQVVDQHVQIDCPPEWKTNATYDWTAPGDILRDYVRTDASGQREYVEDDEFHATGLHKGYLQPAIDFFWEDSTVGAVVNRTVSLEVGNINGETYTVESRYAVNTPTVSASRVPGTEGFDNNAAPSEIGLYNAAGVPFNEGMKFTSSVTMPTGFGQGEWNFLQLWQPGRLVTAGGVGWHFPHNNEWGLDNWAIYGAFLANDPYVGGGEHGSWATATQATTHSTVDMPGLGLNGRTKASVDDQFLMYIMFMPPGAVTKWVALQCLDWGFDVAATFGTAWTLDAGHTKNVGNWAVPSTSPEWDIRHENGAAMVRD